MPSTYAHYRFGAALLPTLQADVRRTIQRFRRLYDVGLHGPDIFFYSSPLLKGSPGVRFHEQTGREFFQRVCRTVRLERSEAAQAYLYGVLCHYCLDAVCGPFIREQAGLTGVPPLRVETEFDRFLLEKDGKTPPCAQDLSPHLRLTPGECETAAKFYPPVSSRTFKDDLRNMAAFVHMAAVPDGARRRVLEKGVQLLGKDFSGMVMTVEPDPLCAPLDNGLMARYAQAEALFPRMMAQLQAHLTYGAPFADLFDPTF